MSDEHDDVSAIDWIDLLVAVVCGAKCDVLAIPASTDAGVHIPTLGREGRVHPALRTVLERVMALSPDAAKDAVAEAMFIWRTQRDGLKGWRMGADGKWQQIDE